MRSALPRRPTPPAEACVRTDGQNEPDVATPDEHGGVWFFNVRVYECRSTTDPVCLRLLTANEGQAPRV